MPNITGGKVNIFYYTGVQPGRLKGNLLAGETDLRAEPIALPANVSAIYGASPSGGFQSFVPSSNFNSLSVLQIGQGYFVDAKTSFDFMGVMPSPSATFNDAALTHVRDQEANAPDPQPPAGSTGYRIGTNLNGLADYSTALPFVDAFKTSRYWLTGTSSQWNLDLNVPVDGSRQATAIPAGAEHIKALMFWDMGFDYPVGEYLLLYTGTGSIQINGATKNNAASVAGREVYTLTGNGGLILQINRPNGSNINADEPIAIRDIRFIPASAEQTYTTEPFNQPYLSKLAPFHSLRFMDWQGTNNSGHTTWATAQKKTDARWMPAPFELCADFCNKLNKDGWVCIPHRADDDYIEQAAIVMRDKLNPNLNVIVEYSNEVWNWQFAQANYALQQGQALWGETVGDAFVQWLGKRTVEIRRIWRRVWGSQANRVKVVLCTQASYLGIEYGALNAPNWVASGTGNPVAPKDEIDLYGIAPYFDGGLHSGNAARTALVASWADQGQAGIDKAIGQLRNSSQFADGGSIAGIATWVRYHKNIANDIGKDFVLYECGQHLIEPFNGTQADKDKCVAFFNMLNRRPEMGDLYLEYFTSLKNLGVKMPMNFADISGYSKYGSWGLWENSSQPNTPKANAVYTAIQTLSGT